MADCEWDDPHDGYARFCLTHECWITAPVTVTACPISDLLGKVQRVRGLHHFVVDEIETREGPEDVQHCSECGYIPTDEEPCPTIRILDGDSDE